MTFLKGNKPWNKGLKGVQKAWNRGKKRWWKSPSFVKGIIPWNKGIKMSDEQKRILSDKLKGKRCNTGRTLFKKGYIMPEETRNKISKTLSLGGDQTDRHREMMRKKYKDWRTSVFKKDGFKCQMCGAIGGRLNADHIKPWSLHKELRYKVSNGRTLCLKCHKNTDTYGWKLIHKTKKVVL